jgi:hypothetical protein
VDQLYQEFLKVADSKKEVMEDDLRKMAEAHVPEQAVA